MAGTSFETTLAEISSESKATPFDAVIVGAGSSGLTFARTLAEAGKRVAILEAGPAPYLTHISNTELRFSAALTRTAREQMAYSPKLPNGDPFGPNFGCFGGRGLFWNGGAPRFRDHDFEGWPIGPTDLAPHFAWAEREFRVNTRSGETPLATKIIDFCENANFAAVPAPFAVDFPATAPGTLSAGIASGLGLFFRVGDLIASKKIRVAVSALSQRILLSGGRAQGITAVQGGVAPVDVLAKSVVLAGGGIESIRLAMLSGVGHPAGLIGAGLQDHLFYRTYFEGPHLYDPARPENAIVFVPSQSQTTEQWELHAPGRRLFSIDDGKPWNPAPGQDYELMIRSFAATDKQASNCVEAHEGGLGSAVVHFEYSAADQARKTRMQEEGARLGKALGLTLKEERFAAPGGSYHEAGGLDMGTDPKTSVTKPDGQFHNVPNLICGDAAAFPRIGATNPHLTIVAVARYKAERLAATL